MSGLLHDDLVALCVAGSVSTDRVSKVHLDFGRPDFIAMFADEMWTEIRVVRGVAVVLALVALLKPQMGDAQINRHRKMPPHAASTASPQHGANARKTPRITIAHAKSVELKRDTAAAKVRSTDNLAARPLIVIDPGHGGRDPGAVSATGTLEKTITLAAAEELRRRLEATSRYRVALTRTGDRTVSRAQRPAFARSHDADLLIAIHADASNDHRPRGASVYVSSGSSPTKRLPGSVSNSGRIAQALAAPEPAPGPGSTELQYSMIEQLADDVRMVGTPARAAHLYVLSSRALPSVLLEMGFLSNPRDEVLLNQPAHRRVLVRAVRDAIDDYFAAARATASRT